MNFVIDFVESSISEVNDKLSLKFKLSQNLLNHQNQRKIFEKYLLQNLKYSFKTSAF